MIILIMNNSKVCIIGLGYIGLPTASILALKGFDVYGVDINKEVVNTINQGKANIIEDDLETLVKRTVEAGNFRAGSTPTEADVFIITVQTPLKEGENGLAPDLTYVRSAILDIEKYIKPGNLIIVESTIPVGTTEGMVMNLLKDFGHQFEGEEAIYLAHCPERVLPGQMIKELIENSRIIGGINEASTQKAMGFYQKFVEGELIPTNSRTAEMVKLTENSYRDVNIAFANELSIICDKEGIDVWELVRLANYHPRVNILNPGPGVGGHCIAVDPWFIVTSHPEQALLLKTAREVNDNKPNYIIERIMQKVKAIETKREPIKIACLGISYKANTDDIRQSPAYEIVRRLKNIDDIQLLVVDPYVKSNNEIELIDIHEAIEHSDIIVVLVDHDIFYEIDKSLLNGKAIIDTRGVFINSNVRG